MTSQLHPQPPFPPQTGGALPRTAVPSPAHATALVEARGRLEPLAGGLTAAIARLAEAARQGSLAVQSDVEQIVKAGAKLQVELQRCLTALPAALRGDIPLAPLRHDLRTPLNAIKGYTELLMEDADDGVDLPIAAMESVLSGLEAMNAGIDAILTLPAPSDARLLDGRGGDSRTVGAAGGPATDGNGRNARILVVDDDLANRVVLERRLRREGYQVLQASDGEEALAVLRTESVDLVLLDFNMPGLRGIEVLQRVRSDRLLAQLPVVMISAGDEVEQIAECLDFGADDYITKPFDATLLRARVGACLERKLLRERQQASWEQRFQTLMEIVVDGVLVIDDEGRIETANATAATIFGLPVENLRNCSIADLLVVEPGWKPAQWAASWSSQQSGAAAIREARARRFTDGADPILFPVELSVREVWYDERRAFATVLRDISVRKAAEERNAYLARFDQITDLPNRTALIERLELLTADEPPASGTLLFIAFANFREISDSVHKELVHELLRAVARRLRPLLEPTDMLAHLGGGEFALVTTRMSDAEAAQKLALVWIETLEPALRLQANEIDIEPHIGITRFPEQGQTAVRLLRNADLALSRARADRGMPVSHYIDAMSQALVARRQTERELRVGLEQNQLELRYQPKIDLATGQLAGAEALVRWRHPLRGYVGPIEFIPIAEASNIILPLGAWVLREAAAQLGRWHAAGYGALHMAVNISANQFRRQNLVALLEKIEGDYGVAPSSLEFEVTESVLMDDVEEARRTLEALRTAGVALAIDDFGTGYSSLSYLHWLPVDTLKVDQSFVRRLGDDSTARAITRTILTLAHSLELKSVAEGIELPDQAVFLTDHGCTLGQGYMYAKPLTAAEFDLFAAASRLPVPTV